MLSYTLNFSFIFFIIPQHSFLFLFPLHIQDNKDSNSYTIIWLTLTEVGISRILQEQCENTQLALVTWVLLCADLGTVGYSLAFQICTFSAKAWIPHSRSVQQLRLTEIRELNLQWTRLVVLRTPLTQPTSHSSSRQLHRVSLCSTGSVCVTVSMTL